MSSSQVDEKVVSLVFNNANFEKNVKTSLSTLDKLKNSLKFNKVPDGLKNISSSIAKVSFAPISRGIQEVHAKFSALEVIGVTALSNITNTAVNAGKRIASAITIDPVKSGFQEYETQINAIQTILSNTRSKGTTLDDVNAALDELNKYADMTIYNFTEMTRNIGTFTAAGIDLDTSVASIKGIANLAAVSGSTSQQAAVAMYQLSQALASGTVKLMDWNSVVNAGMGGQVFQDAIKETARVHGIAIDEMIESEGSFRETLKDGWLTSDILTETLAKFTGDLTENQLRSIGYTEEQIAGIIALGEDANDAATKVKTFTQLFDTTAEALQSGWTQTWELIIGDFEEAKDMLTSISEFLNNIIESSAESRNSIIEGAINPWKKIEDRLNDAGVSVTDFQNNARYVLEQHGQSLDALIEEYGSFNKSLQSGWLTGDIFKEITDSLIGNSEEAQGAIEASAHTVEEYQELVNSIIRGDWGNGDERYQRLTEAGYDYATVQDMVNQQWYNGYIDFENFSDAQLASLGYTEEQIEKIRTLGIEALDANGDISETLDNLTKPTGRELITDTVDKSLQILSGTLSSFSGIFEKVFGTIDSGDIYNVLEGINTFVTELGENDVMWSGIDKFLEGVFTVIKFGIDTIWGLVDGILGFSQAAGEASGFNLWDILYDIGTALIDVTNWFTNSGLVKAVQSFGGFISTVFTGIIDSVTNFFTTLSQSEDGVSFFEYWQGVGETLGGIFGGTFEKLTTLFDTMSGKFKTLVEQGLTPETFVDFMSEVFSGIGDIFGETGDSLLGALTDPFGTIVSYIETFAQNIDSYLSSLKIVGPIYKLLKSYIDKIKKLFNFDKLTGGFDRFGTSIDNVFSGIKTAFETFFGSLGALDENASIEDIEAVFQTLFDNLIAVFTGSDLGEIIQTTFSDIGTNIYNAVSDFLTGLINLINNKIAEVAFDENNPFSGLAEAILTFTSGLSFLPGALQNGGESFGGIGDFLAHAIGLTKAYADELSDTVDTVSAVGGQLTSPLEESEGIITTFLENVQTAFTQIHDFIEGTIGFDGLIVGALGIGVLYIIKGFIDKITGAVKPISDAINNIAGGFKTLATGWSDMQKSMGKASEYQGIALILLSIAAVIGVLAYSMYQMSQLEWNQIAKGAASIGILVVALGILAVIFGVLTTVLKTMNPMTLFAVAAGMISLSASLILMALALKLMQDMEPEQISAGMQALLGMTAMLVVATIILGALGPKVASGAVTIIALSVALILISLALKQLGEINFDADSKTIQNLIILFIGMGLLSKAAKGLKLSSVLALVVFALAMKQLLSAIEMLAEFDSSNFAKSLDNFIWLFAGIASLMFATKLAGKHALSGGIAILLVAAALYLMIPVITFLGSMDPAKCQQGIMALIVMILAIDTMFIATAASGKHALQAGLAILLASFALGVMTLLVVLLGSINPEKAQQGLIALGILVAALDSIFISMGQMGKGMQAKDPTKAITRMLALIVVLVASLAILSFLDQDTLMNSAQSIALVLAALALSFAAMSKIPDSKGITGKIMAMIVAVAAIGIVLGLMAKLDANASLESAGAIGIVLLALAASLWVISKTPEMKGLMGKISAMVVAVAGIGLVLGLMSYFDVEASLTNALALGIVLLAMGVALGIMGEIKKISGSALLAIILMIIVLETAANALNLLQGMDPVQAIGIAAALAIVMVAMTGVMGLCSLLGPVAGQAIKGLLVLIAAFAILEVAMALIGTFADFVGQDTLEQAAEALGTIGSAIGSFLGNLVGGLIGGIAVGFLDQLPAMAESLALFTEKMSGMTELKEEDYAGLDAAISCMEKAQAISQLSFDITGMNNAMTYMDAFVQGAASLSTGMAAMSETGEFDTTNFDSLISMSESMSALQASLVESGGWIQGIFGEKDLGKFGEDMASFCEEANKAIGAINALVAPTDEKLAALMKVSNTMSSFQKTLDGYGGVVEFFMGDNSLSTFGDDMSNFVEQVNKFIYKLNLSPVVDDTRLNQLLYVSERLQGFQETLNGIGGVAAFFFGDTSLKAFGADMAAFVGEVNTFINANNKLEDPKMEKLDAMLLVSKKMQGFQESLEGIGGIVQWFMNGDNSLATFGSDMASFISSFNTFYTSASELDVTPETLDPVIAACNKLLDFKNSLPEADFFASLGSMFGLDSISAFGEEMKHLGMAFASFKIGLGNASVDVVISASEGINTIFDVLNKINSAENISDSVSKFQSYMDELGNISINKSSYEELNVATSNFKSSFERLEEIMNLSFSDVDLDENVSAVLTASLTSASEVIVTSESIFENLGKNLFTKFLDGIGEALDDEEGINAKVTEVINSMMDALSGGEETDEVANAYKVPGTEIITNFCAGISESLPNITTTMGTVKTASIDGFDGLDADFKAVGEAMMLYLSSGISNNSYKAVSAIIACYNAMDSAISILNDRFRIAGENAIMGFIGGMGNKSGALYDAAVAMANLASDTLQATLDEHSPSKRWFGYGDYATEGFIIGLGNQMGQVGEVAEELGNTASDGIMSFGSKLESMNFSELASNVKNSFSDALQPLNNIDLSSLDNTPVIRPVLDLTELESKASTIGSMFENQTLSVGGLSDLGSSISKNQNGSEILSALNDLKKTLGTPVTNSYTINGITYDDGSNITSAIETLVHAAVVEGRM